jgi:outer membrane protein assembly factor BamE (lipoprotein component of BamABCDE complex)
MHSLLRVVIACGAAAILAGCAGADFKRPDTQSLVVGKSTSSDVVRVMGAPRQTGEALKNDQKIRTFSYVYAEAAGAAAAPGVTPARAMVFSTYNEVLVGQEFVSSFAQDSTNFDDSKIAAIVKGKSTRDDVVAVLGKPSAEYLYPMLKQQGDTGIGYNYSQAKGSAFNMRFYRKALVVSFDKDGRVTDIDYSASGEP